MTRDRHLNRSLLDANARCVTNTGRSGWATLDPALWGSRMYVGVLCSLLLLAVDIMGNNGESNVLGQSVGPLPTGIWRRCLCTAPLLQA